MAADRPHLIVLAGPNGAGKSTAAPALLADSLQVTEFVNADLIARGLSVFHPERVAVLAGRIMLGRLDQLADRRANFAFETTLAGRSYARRLAELGRSGYVFHLVFLWLASPEMAVARVAERVRQGGHDVAAEVIRRRYLSGLRNFFRTYRPLADTWRFYNNSGPSIPRLIASGSGSAEVTVADPGLWDRICEGANA